MKKKSWLFVLVLVLLLLSAITTVWYLKYSGHHPTARQMAASKTQSYIRIDADVDPALAFAKRKLKEAQERAKSGGGTHAFNPEKEGVIEVVGR